MLSAAVLLCGLVAPPMVRMARASPPAAKIGAWNACYAENKGRCDSQDCYSQTGCLEQWGSYPAACQKLAKPQFEPGKKCKDVCRTKQCPLGCYSRYKTIGSVNDIASKYRCDSRATVEDGGACEIADNCKSNNCVDGMCCGARCRTVAKGEACTATYECQSGQCIDGVCCYSALCSGACMSCAVSGRKGTCAPLLSGQSDPGICDGDRVCDGSGGCLLAVGKPCSSDEACLSHRCKDEAKIEYRVQGHVQTIKVKVCSPLLQPNTPR